LLKKLFAPIVLVFRKRIRRKWRRYTFLNREALGWKVVKLPLPTGTYRFRYEWWEVWGCPKVGETATQYWTYVKTHGRIIRSQERTEEIESN
jgi:hypothetical protein